MQIITADQRLARQTGVKMVVAGPHGIGKTSLAWTLDAATTLVVNMEAGLLALEGWPGDTIDVRDFDTARNLACLIGGPNPARRPDEVFSRAHYDAMTKAFPDVVAKIERCETIFIDSLMELSRLAFHWSKGQPQAFSEKTGKPDNRGAYGLLGQEVIGLLRHIQHAASKNIVFVVGLDRRKDEYGRVEWTLQLEGGKTQLELPGIVDEMISFVEMKADDGTKYRAFVCQTLNPDGYPAKDRSGRLDLIEEPHLGKLLAKMRGGARSTVIETALPQPGASAPAAATPAAGESIGQPPAGDGHALPPAAGPSQPSWVVPEAQQPVTDKDIPF